MNESEDSTGTTLEDSILVVSDGIDVVPISPDEVLIRFGTRSRPSELLRDAGLKGVISRILLAFNREPTHVGQLLAGLAETEANDARRIIIQLLDKGVLADIDKSPVEQYLRYTFTGHSELKTKSVAVIGGGPVGARIIHSLVQHGIGRIAILDERVADAIWNGFRPIGQEALAKDSPVSVALAEALQERPRSHTNEARQEIVATADSITALLTDSDLAVLALEAQHPRLAHQVNRVALRLGIPWLCAQLDGNYGLVGPLFLPGRTACYSCYAALADAASSSREIARKYRRYLLDRPAPPFFPGLPAYADIVAGHATLAAVQFLLGQCFAIGRVAIFDLLQMLIDTEDVLRLPRCPVCSTQQQRRPAFSPHVIRSEGET